MASNQSFSMIQRRISASICPSVIRIRRMRSTAWAEMPAKTVMIGPEPNFESFDD